MPDEPDELESPDRSELEELGRSELEELHRSELEELHRSELEELHRSELEARAPAELAITDVFDLHSFLPREVADVTRAYLDAAYEKGLRRVRIIHGRGVGVQRRTVRKVLERDPRVVDFGDAPPEAGGWGATWARMD